MERAISNRLTYTQDTYTAVTTLVGLRGYDDPNLKGMSPTHSIRQPIQTYRFDNYNIHTVAGNVFEINDRSNIPNLARDEVVQRSKDSKKIYIEGILRPDVVSSHGAAHSPTVVGDVVKNNVATVSSSTYSKPIQTYRIANYNIHTVAGDEVVQRSKDSKKIYTIEGILSPDLVSSNKAAHSPTVVGEVVKNNVTTASSSTYSITQPIQAECIVTNNIFVFGKHFRPCPAIPKGLSNGNPVPSGTGLKMFFKSDDGDEIAIIYFELKTSYHTWKNASTLSEFIYPNLQTIRNKLYHLARKDGVIVSAAKRSMLPTKECNITKVVAITKTSDSNNYEMLLGPSLSVLATQLNSHKEVKSILLKMGLPHIKLPINLNCIKRVSNVHQINDLLNKSPRYVFLLIYLKSLSAPSLDDEIGKLLKTVCKKELKKPSSFMYIRELRKNTVLKKKLPPNDRFSSIITSIIKGMILNCDSVSDECYYELISIYI